MNLPLLIATLRHLRATQIVHQLKNRIIRPKLGVEQAPKANHSVAMLTEPIAKPWCYNGEGRFSFLNIADSFRDWNMDDHGPLWTYNLNYMDWLEQEGISTDECLRWIDKFIDELPGNKVGQEPYPTALRVINWAKFFSKHPECKNKNRLDSMYAQVLLLERKLEYHLLGNHLLEDAYALFITSIFFGDCRLHSKATKLLLGQLKEQTLPDGAHYEQSPMYHCIMLDRLLDCINFGINAQCTMHNAQCTMHNAQLSILNSQFSIVNSQLSHYAQLMLGHLASIIYKDGSIPLFNDSALGIAPIPVELFDYAKRLGIMWTAIPLRECGFRHLGAGNLEATIDVGNIMAEYQPGHSHADTFSYELRIDGQPIVVDTGISTYNKNERRQYERSTAAHNTVTLNSKSSNSKSSNSKSSNSKYLDSSQVWGGFRIGRRAKVTIIEDEANVIIARHNGFGRQVIHERHFVYKDGALHVEDNILGKDVEAVSYLHFSPKLHAEIVSESDGLIKIGHITIKVEHFKNIELQKNHVSVEYNQLLPCDVLAISFIKTLKYSIIRP